MVRLVFLLLIQFVCAIGLLGGDLTPETILQTQQSVTAKHGQAYAARIKTGVQQVAQFWRDSDGSETDFQNFCLNYFTSDPDTLLDTFERFEHNLEIMYGHNHEINRELSAPLEVVIDPLLPVDALFAEYDPFAHMQDDLFQNKIAFVVLLNFPIYSLNEKLQQGDNWSRLQWAQARLADVFDTRIPASVSQELSRVYVQADDYIANYNIYMNNLVTPNDERLFPQGLTLITHWGLRDELKSHYAEADGLEKQKMIYAVMQHIIRQDIPKVVINNDAFDWDPFANKVYKNGQPQDVAPEPNVRYEKLLSVFHAERQVDKYSPNLPTKMDRQFKANREIPEARFQELISSVLKAPVAKEIAQLISKRLGRPLLPFDIWYDGFKARSGVNEAELDVIVGQRYPTVAAFQQDLPNILQALSFDAATANYLQSKITVDPSRGAGHATGAMRRADNAHLRTRIPHDGMKYKGYNIAIHELGHNVEQVFSLNKMDYYMLNGVPNNAFTEAFAFVFQSRDLDVLGIEPSNENAEVLKALDTYWSTCEIAAVGLVDMRVWRWLYDHPEATPAELNTAVNRISKEVWNEYYYPLTGIKDAIILGVYSHMVAYGLYLPDYSLGHIIMFQIEDYLKDKNLGEEMQRMCRIGRLTPDAWMRQAVGSPISAQPLINAAEKAVRVME